MKYKSTEEIIHLLQERIAEETKLDLNKLDPDIPMGAFGLDSINSIYVLEQLENELGVELNPLMFYDYPTIRKFSSHLLSLLVQ
ncbi:MAG: acyl carrier protein [Cyclobacteriaceae bacterium]